jgi:uncharacterized membrane protein YphA (DoxX/SURF4 family)
MKRLLTLFVFLSFFTFLATTSSSTAFAHVGYVLAEHDFQSATGHDWAFVLSPLFSAEYRWLIIGTALALVLTIFLLQRSKRIRLFERSCRDRALSYHDLIPWMLRLSAGIALLGAGTARALISPLLPEMYVYALAQTLIGFCLLAGFLVGPMTIAGLALFAIGLTHTFYLAGNADFAAALLALLMYADNRPGVDHIFGIRFFPNLSSLKKYVPLVLRVGLGGAMIFLAIYEKFLNPHTSEAIVRAFDLTSVIPVSPAMWVLGVGCIELVVGLCILLGFWTRLVALIAFLVLTLTFFYFGEDVYSHVTLFGVLSVLLTLGGGHLSLDEWLHKKGIEKGAFK